MSAEFYREMYEKYSKMYRELTDEELIESFNGSIGIKAFGWGRMGCMQAMREELTRRFDVSAISDGTSFSFAKRVVKIGNKLEPSMLTNKTNLN